MTSRYTNKVLFLIVILLLVTNVVMLFLFVFTPKKSERMQRRAAPEASMSVILKDSVGFNEKQMAAYQELRSAERPALREYFGNMRATKEKFYDLIYTPESDSLAHLLADSIGAIQGAIDLNMMNYFSKIRKMCTDDQLPVYDSTIKKVVTRMVGRSGNRPKGPNPKPNK